LTYLSKRKRFTCPPQGAMFFSTISSIALPPFSTASRNVVGSTTSIFNSSASLSFILFLPMLSVKKK